MPRKLALLLPLALAACTGERAAPSASSNGGRVKCLYSQQASNRWIANANTIVFRTVGRYYRNDLPAACPGLENRWSSDPIAFEVHGSQICAGDSFRAFDASAARAVGIAAFPRCRLGPFTPISEEEAEALRPRR